MIVRGEPTVIDYHTPFDQGFMPCFLFLFFWPLTLLSHPSPVCNMFLCFIYTYLATKYLWGLTYKPPIQRHYSSAINPSVVFENPKLLMCFFEKILHWIINFGSSIYKYEFYWLPTCKLLDLQLIEMACKYSYTSSYWQLHNMDTWSKGTHFMICASLVTLFKRFDCTWVSQYRQHPVNEKPRVKTMSDY